LRDDSKRVIAGLQATYAEATGIKALKVRHNNVIGYFVEVPSTMAARCWPPPIASCSATVRPWQTSCGSPPLNSASSNRACPWRRAAPWRWNSRSSPIWSSGSPRRRKRSSTRPGRWRGWMSLPHSPSSPRASAMSAPGSTSRELSHRRRPPSGGRDGAGARRRAGLRAQRLRSVGRVRRGPLHLARHRSQHGRQVDLPAPERAHCHPGADGLLRARRTAHIGIVDRLFSRVGAADDLARGRSTSWSRWSRPPPFSIRQGTRAGHPRRDRPRHGDLRRAVDCLGQRRAPARGQPLPGAVRHPFSRAHSACLAPFPACQRHHEGARMARRGDFPA
jgi:DNA mismatch repair protein MutS